MRRKSNNKGSTLVMVMIILAFVGILATIALWISLNNFQMKITDKNVTDNFYSAEGVLDQIRAGLQQDVSDSLDVAYNTVMQQYASLTEEGRDSTFANSYVFELRNKLRYSGGTITVDGVNYPADMLCDLAKLKGYVSKDVLAVADVKLHPAGNDGADYCLLSTTSEGVIIKDLVVEYTDASGYLSIIQTDIVLAIPKMNMVDSEGVPKLFNYSIIGNAGVEVQGNGTTVNGSVYAGSLNALDPVNNVNEEDFDSIVVALGATVDFTGADYVIADGNILLNGQVGSNLKFITNPAGELWGRNLVVSGTTAGLYGTTYLSDDMTLSGKEPKVTFSQTIGDATTYGSYVGYGESESNPAESSAIIINGTDAVLDLSGVDSMVVGGYAYIGTSKIRLNETEMNSTDILLGESISVKGDQIAYLVPSECIGTVNGVSSVFQNPISVGDYETMVNNPETYTLVNPDVTIGKLGKSLRAYGVTGANVDNFYTKIIVPSKTGDPKDGLVYFYLNLDAANAQQYFLDYYNVDSTRLARYTDFYTNGIQTLGEEAQIYTAGIYAQYEEGNLSSLQYQVGNDPINGGVGNLPNKYEALTTKLVTELSSLSSEEIGKTVFSNVINVDEFKNFLSTCPEKKFTVEVDTANGGKYTAVLIDNKGGSAYVHTDGDLKNSYLIIASGDVTVSANFTGTIIADGKVTVSDKANITIYPITKENVKNLLYKECDNGNGTSVKLYEFFKDGKVYASTEYVADETEDALAGDASAIDLSELITYQNWKKK